MFQSIDDIKQANREHGYHWFNQDSMEFFDSIVYPDLVQHPEGAYFVSSERFDSRSPRLFTVRFARFTGEVNPVGPFRGHSTQQDAWQYALSHKYANGEV